MKHGQRGQTLPVWAFGSLSLLVLVSLVINYGNILAWQFRAQNAADAAARALLSIQDNQWNQEISTVHAAAVEEYRLRNILNDLYYVAHDDGGCVKKNTDATGCAQMYTNLRGQFLDSLNRYTADIQLLNRIVATHQGSQVSTMKQLLAQMQQSGTCGTASGLDCSFTYTLVGTQDRYDSYMEDVYSDATSVLVGADTSSPSSLGTDLQPLDVEVVACAKVNGIFPSVYNLKVPTFFAIGRAAATSIMATQETMYLGSVTNPITGNVFQPSEFPESTTGSPVLGSLGDTYDQNYRIDYGGYQGNPYGNPGNASTTSSGVWHFQAQYPGIQVFTGWWTAMPIRPFMGNLQQGTSFTCPS
jgi:hypothetical protein